MKQLQFLLLFLSTLLLVNSCASFDSPSEKDSFSVLGFNFSGCLDDSKSSDNPHIVTLEAKNGFLYIYRKGPFNCATKLSVNISKEGDVINIEEKNLAQAVAKCDCPMEYSCAIDKMEKKVYIINFVNKFKPFRFTYYEGAVVTVELSSLYSDWVK